MICENCGNWNYLDSKFCRFCGRLLNHNDFSLYRFFIENKDLFIIFGVFGAISVYLTGFSSNGANFVSNNTLSGSTNYSVGIGIFSINLLNLAIASSLFLVIVVSALLIIEIFKIQKYQGLINSYILQEGSLQRLIFLIPFIVLLIGIMVYLYYSFINEINQLSVIYAYFGGFFAVFLLTRELFRKFNKRLGMISLIYFVFWFIAGIINAILMPLIPSKIFLINALFLFNGLFGQGVALLCIVSFIFWVVEKIRNFRRIRVKS